MCAEDTHGFHSREAWAHFFEEYNASIVRLSERGFALLKSDLELKEWVETYRENSHFVRVAFEQNEALLNQHIYYFTDEPARWRREIADPLLCCLFRSVTRMEDMSCAFHLADSLTVFYEALGDEISLMKCCTVKAFCYAFLDSIHWKTEILQECDLGCSYYERNFERLNPEEQSMGLSLYDIQFCTFFDGLRPPPEERAAAIGVMIQACQKAIIYEKLVRSRDNAYDFNQTIPPFQTYLTFLATAYAPEDFTPEQAAAVSAACDKEYREKRRRKGQTRYQKIVSRLTMLMGKRLTGALCDAEIEARFHEFINWFPKDFTFHGDLYGRDMTDAIVQVSQIAETIFSYNRQSPDYQRMQQIVLDYYSSLPLNTYTSYIASTNTYPFICCSLRFLGKGRDPLLPLLRLTVFRQPQTAMHSIMVARLATAILESVIENRPELLDVFALTPEKVRANSSALLDFIYTGAMLHDVGKILCSNVINTQYRRLFDVEFDTLRFHPTTGGEMLKSVPQLSIFYDIAVGHHKTFDGTGGYPNAADNSLSPLKIFIDIITICDSLDAATDQLGRNYAHVKSFDTVLDELRAGKDSRYAGRLVELISEDEALLKKLRYLLDQGRGETYFSVHQMIQKRTGILPRRLLSKEWQARPHLEQ